LNRGRARLGAQIRVRQTLQEAKPKAGSILRLARLGNADRRWESSPEVERHRFPGLIASAIESPRRKSIGADAWRAKRHVGPGFQKWNAHPSAGTNLRRAVEKNPGAPPGEHLRKEELSLHTVRPARPQGSPPRVAEHRAEKRPRRCMTRGWTAREK
jgi:hypothetical protein